MKIEYLFCFYFYKTISSSIQVNTRACTLQSERQKTMNQLFQLLGEFQRNDYIVFQNSTKSHNSSICSIVNHMPLSRSKRVRKNITECLRLILEGALCCLDQEMKKEMIMKMGIKDTFNVRLFIAIDTIHQKLNMFCSTKYVFLLHFRGRPRKYSIMVF